MMESFPFPAKHTKIGFLCGVVLFCIFICGVNSNSISFVKVLNYEGEGNLNHFSKRFIFNDQFDDDKMKVKKYLSRDVIKEHLDGLVKDLRKKKILVMTKITGTEITEEFTAPHVTLKEVLFLLQFFPLIYKGVKEAVVFRIPIKGKYIDLGMKNQDNSECFKAALLISDGKMGFDPEDLAPINSIAEDLQKAAKDKILNDVKNGLQALFVSKLDSLGHIKDTNIFKAGIKFLLSTSLQRKAPDSPSMVLKELNFNVRSELDKYTVEQVQGINEVKLKYELTYSMMMKESSYKTEWEELSNNGIVAVTDPDEYITMSVNPMTNQVDLRTIFKLLQSILYFSHGKVRCVVPIGGKNRIFYLSRATRGDTQILVQSNDADWALHVDNSFSAPSYNDIIHDLSNFPNQNLLADIMIQACTLPLNAQPKFEDTLKDPLIIRRVVEFLVIAMVAEAATPTDLVKKVFIEELARSAVLKKHFPEWNSMPKLDETRKDVRGSGRSPTMDDVALKLLYIMKTNGGNIKDVFSVANFPVIDQGGVAKGRNFVYIYGESDIPSFWIRKMAGEIVEAAATCTSLIPI